MHRNDERLVCRSYLKVYCTVEEGTQEESSVRLYHILKGEGYMAATSALYSYGAKGFVLGVHYVRLVV